MATAVWRNASRLRNFHRRLYARSLSQFRSPIPSSTTIADSLRGPSLPSLRPAIPVGAEFRSLGIFGRYLSNCTAAPNENQEKSSSSSNTDSEGPQNTGGSQRSSGSAGKSVRGGPVSWLSFLLLLATGIGIILYYDNLKKRHIEEISNASKAVKEGPSAGKAAIGGPFNICPDELQKLAAAIDKIKEKSGIEIVPVFISVDPERDTVEQVREYVKEFHPKLVGLTGSPDEIKKVARAYRVYYMKTAEEDSDYLVDHSIVM
ncbi:homologue of the copper chaperone SCO1 [Hibiscus trionum]|uniref:Homologue of the copper chaperone SCO1 n=1 Tax=Hibiscus trionum TaxID=183268 RepID=A0A9W7HM58_HIBTR|nr:homologue of the copper chaperone SCO1 [Hibiscus trionum]